jgi:hypothetical protein
MKTTTECDLWGKVGVGKENYEAQYVAVEGKSQMRMEVGKDAIDQVRKRGLPPLLLGLDESGASPSS